MKRVALLVLLLSTAAHAQGNYRASPIGGRTTLMGGTGVADARDGAAPFLNPATVVRIEEGRLAFSVNFYSLTLRSASHWFRPGEVDATRFGVVDDASAKMTDATFDALPSSLCLFFGAGHELRPRLDKDPIGRSARLAVCFATTQEEDFTFAEERREQRATVGLTRQSQTVSHSFRRFAIGPTYALHLSEGFAIGASVHGSLVNERWFTSSILDAPATSSVFVGTSRGTSFDLSSIVGATYRFGTQTVGLAIETPDLPIAGRGGATVHASSGAGQAVAEASAAGSFAAHRPLRVGIGTAVVDGWGAAEVDVSYWAPMDHAYSVDFDDAVGTRGVVGMNAGAEINVSPTLSFLGGASTDVGAVRLGEVGGSHLFQYFIAGGDRIAGSLGVRSRGPDGDFMFGTELSHTRSQRLAVNGYAPVPALTATPDESWRILLVIAGSTSFGAIRRAAENVKDVLDPRHPK